MESFFESLRERLQKVYAASLFSEPSSQRVLLGFFLFVFLTFALSSNFFPETVPGIGETSIRDIRAPRSGMYIDKLETEKSRKAAEERVEKIYEHDPKIDTQMQAMLEGIFDATKDALRKKDVPADQKAVYLKKKISFSFQDSSYRTLVSIAPETLDTMKSTVVKILKAVTGPGLRDDQKDLVYAHYKVRQELKNLPWQKNVLSVLSEVLIKCMRPNLIVNEKETKRRKEMARDSVKPVIRRVSMGDILVQRGEAVAEEHMLKFEAAGLGRHAMDIKSIFGTAILNIIFLVLVVIYMQKAHKEILSSNLHLLFLCLLIIVGILTVKLLNNPLLAGSGYQVLIPVGACVMLSALFFNVRFSYLLGTIISLYLGLIMGGDLRFFVLSLLTSVVAAASCSSVTSRRDVVSAGIYISLVNAVAIVAFSFMSGDAWRGTLVNIIFGLGNGIGASVLAMGALIFVERPFGLCSHLHLLELANPNEPILRRLMQEAPGTYNHSVYVGNLSEAAAHSIGADSLLCRVGAYYHDIGKIKRPYFFVENQMSSENLHDQITPSMSAMTIRAHVSDGLELADQYKLPPVIKQFIPQHHGTSLISFFYTMHRAAMQEQEQEKFSAEDEEHNFRYEGPRPQTRETAIVCLADSIEAAVRSLPVHTPETIRETVSKIMARKVQDGQLDECDITLRDLVKIRDSFATHLEGMWHGRMEYPEPAVSNGQ